MKVTTKGQVTIPQEVRESMGIRPSETEIDFVQDKNQYRNLVETIVNTRSGRHYYNPLTRDI